MQSSVYSTERIKSGIVLDPRTKLLMMITITTLLLSTGNKGVMNIIKPVLSAVPFLLLLTEKQFKTAGKYLILYGLCFMIERIALSSIGGIISFILFAVCSIMTRFAPGIMMGAFLLKSTSVSEFIASMEKIHIPEEIVIPLSVIFRFFPTIKQEYRAINDAMRMRGIRFGGKNPLLIIEYRLIPLIFSVIKIGDELSAAAITRGLGAPVKRTNVCKIGFHIQDILMMTICISCFLIFFMQN
ncbi:energy-coupling factor transporter transmembrane component T [Clostridium estertheticum]|uniref:energy-coupling factor transporter transmembrane component T n=1 Tax=Clostridium estertheticum TaxID=238834 RepID=UPI001CF25027|nr:energy-coupling factor transporter transmembrane component T [Clostridium estertheticum]MCB2361699.1 energy-coupling factor transporter transmembrane protein EcfT [Clostridium estertheticum]